MTDDDADRPLTPAENDLASIAHRGAPDGFLMALLLNADIMGLGFGVGLLVNGMLITAQLARPEHMAEDIDRQRRVIVESISKPDELSDEEWERARDRFATAATAEVEQYHEHGKQLEADLAEHGADGGIDLATAPGDVARRVIAHDAPVHVTLRNAHIFAPGQLGSTRVPAMRVPVAHIAGWWILHTDAEGNSTVKLWETD